MKSPVIFTCFAGRQKYLEILFVYVDKLIQKGLVDEFHVWDYSRNIDDNRFIRNYCMSRPKYRMISVFNDSFKEYYDFYTKARYPDPMTIIIKCDDDIVYIDIDQFSQFIENRRSYPDFLLASAAVINNPVCNLLQFKLGILPIDYFSDEKLANIANDVETVTYIHRYFLEKRQAVIDKSRSIKHLQPFDPRNGECRLSINFIAILGKDLDVFQTVAGGDDEVDLAIQIPIIFNRQNYIDTSFIVVHSAFSMQRNAGFDDDRYVNKYKYIAFHTETGG